MDVWTVAVHTTLPVYHIGLLTMDQGLVIISKNHPRSAHGRCVKFGKIDIQDRSITFMTDFMNISLDQRFLCTIFRMKPDETAPVTVFEASRLTEDNNGVIVVENSRKTATLAIYLPHHNELLSINPLTPEMVYNGQSLLCIRGQIYIFVCGGRLYRFDPVKRWTEMCSTNDYHDTPAIEMDGFAYVLGSTTSQRSRCERYDPCTNTWTCVGHKAKSSKCCCYATLNGWIYAIGLKNRPTARSVERFNPNNGVWDDVAPINGIRPISAATLHGKIYVLGRSSIQFYNQDLDIWTVAVIMTLPVHLVGLFTVDQDLMIISNNHPTSVDGRCVKFWTVNPKDRRITSMKDFQNMSLDPRFSCACFKFALDYLVPIHVDGTVFTSNLTRLARRNYYFRSMFSHGFLENHTRTVTFTNVDTKSLQLCIERIESGSSSTLTSFSIAEIEKYLHCARMLLFDEFVTDLTKEYIKLLSVETFEEIIRISYKYDLLDLEEACDLFATENFEQLTTHPCFLSMESEYVKLLLKSRIQLVPQIKVLQAVIVWVEHDFEERKMHFGDLLSFIDLFRIELFHLMNARIETSPVMAYTRNYSKLLDKAIRKRSKRQRVLLFKNEENGAFSVYVSRRKKPTRIRREFPQGINFCFTALDNLYVFDKSCQLFCFPYTDPKAVWVEKAQLKLEGDNLKFALSGGCLFVFGKNEGARYNCDDDAWSSFTTYGNRKNFAVVACSEWIYLLGGKEETERRDTLNPMSSSTVTETVVSNSVVRYNTVSNEWREDIAAMKKARYDATAVCCGNIYALGGKNELDEVLCHYEQYDPLTNVWNEIKATWKLRSNFTTVAADGKLLLFGPPRRSWQIPVTYISTYDQRRDIWRSSGSVDGKFSMESIVSVSLPCDWFT